MSAHAENCDPDCGCDETCTAPLPPADREVEAFDWTSPRTGYSYDRTSGSMPGYLPRSVAYEKLRASAAESIASAQRLLAVLNAGEVEIDWSRGWTPLPAPEEATEGQA